MSVAGVCCQRPKSTEQDGNWWTVEIQKEKECCANSGENIKAKSLTSPSHILGQINNLKVFFFFCVHIQNTQATYCEQNRLFRLSLSTNCRPIKRTVRVRHPYNHHHDQHPSSLLSPLVCHHIVDSFVLKFEWESVWWFECKCNRLQLSWSCWTEKKRSHTDSIRTCAKYARAKKTSAHTSIQGERLKNNWYAERWL